MNSTATKAVQVEIFSSGIVLVTMDAPGSSANVLTVELFAALEQTFSELQQRSDLKGLILYSTKPSIFVAGADLKRINATLNWPDKEIVRFCDDGRSIMSRLSEMPFPTLAAIHGACVGGGLEIALWCDYRIASNDRKTILGLPEVKLGLVPGWAGTVRLPRIADLDAAVDLITSGRVASADQALGMGFVDQVCDREELIDASVDLILNEGFENSTAIREEILKPVERVGDVELIREQYSERIDNNPLVYPLACRLVLDHLVATAAIDHDQACHNESLVMAKVYGSEPSYGLLNHFFLNEHNKKNAGFVDLQLANKKMETIGIVGAGLMGVSIARSCIKSGHHVVVLDAAQDAVISAQAELEEIAVSKNVKLQTTLNYENLRRCDLVIESVVEIAEVKKTVLQKIESAVSEATILATNTSAIPLAKLTTGLERPQNFCGIHFCHPELMSLVEVVKGSNSGAETIANAAVWIRGLRKMPIVINDHSGFVVNRLLAAMLDQAFRLFCVGFEIREIDLAMREFGFLGGPFEIVDVIGAEICMYAGREMFDGGVNCVTLSPILPCLVKKGWHGRRAGRGFYAYDTDEMTGRWNEDVVQLLDSYVDKKDKPDWDRNKIAKSICSAMVREAAAILDDGLVNSPQDIDLCAINGFGFPAHVGGVLFWADRRGIAKINAMLNELGQWDAKLRPSSRLVEMESSQAFFYERESL